MRLVDATPAQRFWAKVDRRGPQDCWLWGGSRNDAGYGVFRSGIGATAHRYSYYLAHGKLSRSKMVCHTCDNPPCVNPNHLFAGDAQDNTQDANWKGRLKHAMTCDCRNCVGPKKKRETAFG